MVSQNALFRHLFETWIHRTETLCVSEDRSSRDFDYGALD